MLTPWRLRAYPLAMLGAVLVAFVVFVARAQGMESGGGRVGGDFAAFLGAGRLVAAGEVAQLYDVTAQTRAQEGLVPPGTVLPFAYPPFLAALYVPFTWTGPIPAYVLHTLAMGAVLASAVLLAVRALPRLGAYRAPAIAGAVLFYPLARAVFGGQNTALSVLCAAGAFAARGSVARGAWLGLWMFKPQLALPVLGVVALREPRVLLGAAPVVAAWWGMGALVAGPGWVGEWMGAVAPFMERDRGLNPAGSVSLYDLGVRLGGDALGGALAVGTAMVIVALGWTRPKVAIPVAAALAPLLAPHALFYDAGLALVALLCAAAAGGRAGLGPVLLVWAAALLQLLGGPWSMGVAVVAAGLAWRRAG